MDKRTLMIKQLDRQLQSFHFEGEFAKNFDGSWIRRLRKAFGMTIAQLAKRMKVHASRIVRMEQDEKRGAITLRSLQAAAQAMNCELIYAFVTKTTASIETTIKEQAKKIARKKIERIAHSMSLEDQATNKEYLQEQLDELVDELLSGSPKHLWEEE